MEHYFLLGIRIFYGFSFIQLMTVLAILSILTLASAPSFIELYQQYHLVTTTQNLYYVMQYAKSEAIKNNNTVYVEFQTGDNWCYGVNLGATCDCTVTNSCSLGSYATPQTQDLSFSSAGANNHAVYFEGTHGAADTSSTLTFTVYGQSKALSIKVNRLGSLLVCSSTISGYPSCT